MRCQPVQTPQRLGLPLEGQALSCTIRMAPSTSIWCDSGAEDPVPVPNSTAGRSEPRPKHPGRVSQAAERPQTLRHLSPWLRVNLLLSAKGTGQRLQICRFECSSTRLRARTPLVDVWPSLSLRPTVCAATSSPFRLFLSHLHNSRRSLPGQLQGCYIG